MGHNEPRSLTVGSRPKEKVYRVALARVLRRVLMLALVVWAAATINFFLPRLATGRDPVREKLGQLVATGGIRQEGIEEMVRAYQVKFGLDKPLWVQYGHYLSDIFTLDFGYSLALYPSRVSDLVGNAMPWSIGLLLAATLISFVAGNILGALSAWPRVPRICRMLVVPVIAISAIPFFLLGLILVYLMGVQLELFPISGGYTPGVFPALSFDFAFDVLRHSVLPALSLILAGLGFWALGMRGMIVSTIGEDFMKLAQATGLKRGTIFFRYAIRNAILPQYTALGLSLGYLVSGQVAVEVVFDYPGIGTLLFSAIKTSDYTLINGIVFFTIVSIGLMTVILDLSYPLLDPRIGHRRKT